MQNSYTTSPFFGDFATAIKTLRENMTYVEFDNMLKDISKASDKGKLSEFIDQAEYFYYNEGTDLASAFHFAWFDLIQDQGEKSN